MWPPKSAEMQLNNLQNQIGKDQGKPWGLLQHFLTFH